MSNQATGLMPAPIPIRSYDYDLCRASKEAEEAFPESYILPEERIPDVYDQGMVGACVSFSTCSCAESHLRRSGDTTRLSQGLFYGRYEVRGNYEGSGLYADRAMQGAVKFGFAPYSLYPLLEEVPEAIQHAKERDDLIDDAAKIKPKAYASLSYALEDKKWNSIRTALYKDKSALIIVSHDYFRGGSHAVMGIGYTNKKGKTNGRYVVFQNSWGKNWSVDGRSEIPINKIDEAYVLIWDEIKLPFTDVSPSDWFFDEVRSVYLSGLVSGTSATAFSPSKDLLRGDIAIIVARMLDKLEYSANTFAKSKRQQGASVSDMYFKKYLAKTSKYSDVSPLDYYKDAIHYVSENGIMKGVSGTEFSPKTPVTRAEMAAITIRVIEVFLDKLKVAIPANYKLPSEGHERFTDVKASDWYNNYVSAICDIGIMEGNGDGTFAPQKNIIRCEGAAVLHRLFKVAENIMMQAI